MNWFNAPFDDHDVLLWLPVFWWNRISIAFQFLSGLSVVAELLTQQQKEAIHGWLSTADPGRPVTPQKYPWKAALIYFSTCIVVVSLGFAAYVGYSVVYSPTRDPALPATVGTYLTVASVLLPIFGLTAVMGTLGATLILNILSHIARYAYMTGRRRYFPRLAPWFEIAKFDKTILWLSVVLFLVSTAIQVLVS